MRDLLDILAAHATLPPKEPATLATVVRVEGSAYRLPGARMLIDAAGHRTGSVSGGCLEADVSRRGRLLTADSPTALVRYDGTADADTAWSYALGCDGAIEIFIERFSPSPGTPGEGRGEGDFECKTALNFRNPPHPSPLPAYRARGPEASLNFLRHCVANRTPGVLATIFAAPTTATIAPVTRFMLTTDSVLPTTRDPLQAAILADANDILLTAQTTTITYQTPAGPIHALLEYVHPPMPLIICGAGHDAVPLTEAAKTLGWHVSVLDRRQGYARADRFPAADIVRCIDPAAPLSIPAGAAMVLMTHHYPDDLALLRQALPSAAAYIGVLGPRARTQRMLSELATAGFVASPQQLDRLHAPIGLDLGAEGPTQVALSITAEILAATNARPGTPLRQRQGPIHTPSLVRTVTTLAPVAPETCSVSSGD